MTKYSFIFIGVVLLILFTLFPENPLLAQQQEPIDETALVMVIDNSGSMGGNDGTNLRYAATRLIMQVADAWDQIGVICFGDAPATILPLEALGSVADRESKINQVTQSNCAAGGGTNMTAGIQNGSAALANSQVSRKYMLVLTDGEPTTGGTIEAILEARNQGITVIPVALGSGANAFFAQLQAMNIDNRLVNNNQQLIEEFAAIYAALKPDRYVELLNAEQNEMRVNTGQQVDRVTFVLPPGGSLLANSVTHVCPGDPICKRDIQGKYDLLTFDGSPVEGRWELAPNVSAVVITKANFRPALAYPPTDDTTQTGYYIQRSTNQTIIARLEGLVADDAPISINTGGGTFAQAPVAQQTYLLTQFPGEQNSATIQLGDGTIPLVVRKDFPLAPVPNPEPDLPRLEAVNPDRAGQAQLEGDNLVRMQVSTPGNTALVTNLGVWAVVIDQDTAMPVFGPEPLQLLDGIWQSPTPLQVNPGTSYRVVSWMNATRAVDGLRYGDQIDTTFVLGGAIRVTNLPNLTLEDFQRTAIPFAIEVTEPGKQVDIQADLIWEEQPPGANAQQSFAVQLRDNQVSNSPGGETSTELLPTAPDDLCVLPEGSYNGYIEFSTQSDLPVIPRRVDITGVILCGGIRLIGKNSLTFDDFMNDIPYRVGVDAANREIDLDARLVWEDRPIAAESADDFQVQLPERFFSNAANETTETVLETSAPDDLCALPEGNYRGYVEFATSTDAPITPNRIPIEDRIDHGDIQVLTTKAIDLGLHCSLPGLLNILCFSFGNEAQQSARLDIEVPTCVSPANIDVTVASIDPPEDESPALSTENIDISVDPVQIEVRVLGIPPIQLPADVNRRQVFNGEMIIGRTGQQGQPDLAQFTYTKQSLLDTITPVPWAVSWRLGNWLATAVIGIGVVLLGLFIFGKTKDQEEAEQTAAQQKPKSRRGGRNSDDLEDEDRRSLRQDRTRNTDRSYREDTQRSRREQRVRDGHTDRRDTRSHRRQSEGSTPRKRRRS